jgi:hypothetical protein
VEAGLIYGQVKKSYRRRKLVRVTHVMRPGTEAAFKAVLQGLSPSGRVSTAFIERVNLTLRHGVAALARRTWATVQQSPHLLAHLEWWRAYYHFVRPHASLRVGSCSLENEVANFWSNATGSLLQRWQRGKPIESGPCGKCSVILCRRCRTSLFERICSKETHRELEGDGFVKMKAGTGTWANRMNYPP